MNPQDIQMSILMSKHNQNGRKCGKSDLPKKSEMSRIVWASQKDIPALINNGLIEQSNDMSKTVLTPNQIAYRVVMCNLNQNPGSEGTVNIMFENQNDLNAKGQPTVFELKSAIVRIVRDPSADDSED